MPTHDVVLLRFSGGIYDKGTFDAAAMRVVIAFQQALTKLSRSIYLSHQQQAYASSNVVDLDCLGIKQNTAGSTAISIQIIEEAGDFLALKYVREEIDQATTLMYEAYSAADKGERLPIELPSELLPLIASVRSHLRAECKLDFSMPENPPIPITKKACDALRKAVTATYEAQTSVTGEVFEVNVKKQTCRMFDITNKLNVIIHYEAIYKEELASALTHYTDRLILIEGVGEFNNRGHLLKLKNISNIEIRSGDTSEDKRAGDTIFDYIDKLIKDSPDEIWEDVPEDLAENHDNYIQ